MKKLAMLEAIRHDLTRLKKIDISRSQDADEDFLKAGTKGFIVVNGTKHEVKVFEKTKRTEKSVRVAIQPNGIDIHVSMDSLVISSAT